ncbi:ubiquitin fusion degradation protein 1 homolog [Anopheles aquasalis]|uniref:Ubiquitin fusion degradation protein 1 homolog n=3 Tax=argyritarsis section TaxID=44545 RepID=W5J4X4_ANODA|nr:ubiquitin fusion degradation protein 1 homolog [Anopheles darlingi]XP_050085535.1 ubiquitin fusion degradation protein 1 homolog [Anopheles aquasalis]ETN59006.1 ubiquitin fusion degradation protein 1 [Anopheles darlingi]
MGSLFQFNGFNMFPDLSRPFNTTYKCYSVSMLPGNERQDVENGGKIIMPPSALDQLTRLNVVYPMLFKLTNSKINRVTHAGVLEFVADEGKIYIPYWMMRNLLLEEGDFVEIECVSIPVATYSKFEPQSVEFLDITNPKAVLENCLRNFACLTTGDLIAIKYNNTTYELSVLETKPGPAVTIIECDMNVEFAAPVGYKEPERKEKEEEPMTIDPTELMPEPTGFVAFKGEGTRLDGKKKKDNGANDVVPVQRQAYVRGIPDYDHPFGLLRFDRSVRKVELAEAKPEEDQFREFQGEGFSLKKSRK